MRTLPLLLLALASLCCGATGCRSPRIVPGNTAEHDPAPFLGKFDKLQAYRATQQWPDDNGTYMVLPDDNPATWPRPLDVLEREHLAHGIPVRINPNPPTPAEQVATITPK